MNKKTPDAFEIIAMITVLEEKGIYDFYSDQLFAMSLALNKQLEENGVSLTGPIIEAILEHTKMIFATGYGARVLQEKKEGKTK